MGKHRWRWPSIQAKHFYGLFLLELIFAESFSCPTATNYYAIDSFSNIFVGKGANGGEEMDCTFRISRSIAYGPAYFLELKWLKFNVPGKMPTCEENHVQVSLTRSSLNMGRICTDNLQSNSRGIFAMYSHDDVAEVKYHIKKEESKFTFYLVYRLRNRNFDFITSGLKCMNPKLTHATGNFYSSEWPKKDYSYSFEPCVYQIEAESNTETKIYFMDVDLKQKGRFCPGSNDYLLVKGTNDASPFDESDDVTEAICGRRGFVAITTDFKRIYIRFSRKSLIEGSTSRGFAAGYLVYEKKKLGLTTTVIALLTCLCVVLSLLIAFGVWYRCVKVRRRRQHRSQSAHPESIHASFQRVAPNNNTNDEGNSCALPFITPPPYSAEDPYARPHDELPPPYSEVVSMVVTERTEATDQR